MAESLKEKLCEKAVDVFFDLFTNLSYDELKEFLIKTDIKRFYIR